MSNSGKIEFQIALNNRQFVSSLEDSKRRFKSLANDLTTQGHRIDTEFDKVGKSLKSGVGQALNGLKNSVIDLGKNMLGLSAIMSSGAMFTTLIADAKEFSRQMRIVSTISEEVTKNMGEFKNKVLDICSQISVAPATAAAALYQINSAGHTGAAGLQILEVAAKAAVAGVTETSTAADTITTVMNAYGLGANEAMNISDKLFTTVRLGKTTMAELGHSISTVAPVAATFGVSIDEVLAVVAELTKQGVPTATAMTQIRSAITAVTESLGDGAFKTRSLLEAFEEVNENAKGSENALKTDLGNIRALQAVLMATGQHASETAKFIEEMGDSVGATEDAFNKMNTTSGAQLTILKNNFMKQFQEMSDSMTSTLGGLASSLNEAFDDGSMQLFLSLLKDVIIAWGVYKASVLLASTSSKMMYSQEIAGITAVLGAKKAEYDADIAEAVAKGTLTAERAAELNALRAEIASKIEELAVSERILQAEVAQLQIKMENMAVQLSLSKMKVAACREEYAAALSTGNAEQIAAAKTKLATAVKQHNALARQSSATKIKLEKTALDLETVSQQKNTLMTKKDTVEKNKNRIATTLLTSVTGGLRKALNGLKTAFMSNPLGLILTGATMLVGVLSSVSDSMDEASASTSEFGEAADKQLRQVNTLMAIVDSTSEESKVHKDAVEQLKEIYDRYNITLDETIDLKGQLAAKSKEVEDAIKKEGKAVHDANILQAFDNDIENQKQKLQTAIRDSIESADIVISTGTYGKISTLMRDAYKGLGSEMTQIIQGIVDDQYSELLAAYEQGGVAWENKVAELRQQIYEAGKRLGIDAGEDAKIADFDRTPIEDYLKATSKLIEARDNLKESMADDVEVEGEAAEASALSFDALCDAIYNTEEEVENLDGSEAAPTVDDTSVVEATDSTTNLQSELFNTNLTAMPIIKTDSIDNAIVKTNELLLKLAQAGVENSNGKGALATPSSSGKANSSSGGKSSKPSSAQAKTELENRKNEAYKTLGGTEKLIKDIDKRLKTAIGQEFIDLSALRREASGVLKKFKKDAGMSGGGRSHSGGGDKRTPQQIAADVEKATLKTDELIEESTRKRNDILLDLTNQRLQMEIELERDAAKQRQMQLELDYKKEKEQNDKRVEEAIVAERERQKKIFDAVEDEKKAADKKYVKKNFTDEDVDQAEIDKIIKSYEEIEEAIDEKYQRKREEILKSELVSMNTFLAQYGTYYEKRYAIARDYEEKMKNAKDEGERRQIEAEFSSKNMSLKADEMQRVNWGNLFGDFGHMFSSVVQTEIEEAKKVLDTEDYKEANYESKKLILDAIRQMEQALDGNVKVSFDKMGKDVAALSKSLQDLRDAEAEQKSLLDILADAESAYTAAIEKGDEEEIKSAKIAMDAARENADAAAENVESLQLTADAAQQTVSDTATALKAAIDDVMGGLRGLASGGIAATYEGFIQLGQGLKSLENIGKVGKAIANLSDKLKNVPIVGWIVSIIDLFKDGISIVVESLLSAISNAVSGIIRDVFTLNLAKTIGEGILNLIGEVWDAISFGGLGRWLKFDDSIKDYEKTMNHLALTNEALEKAIENLSEEMKYMTAEQASEALVYQRYLVGREIMNKQQEMQNAASSYSNGVLGVGGSHSGNYRIDKGMNDVDWAQINRALSMIGSSTRVHSASDLWSLSPDEMKAILDYATEQMAKIKELAAEGHHDASEFIDDYIALAEKREEIETAYREKMTSYSFDSVYDEFKNCLTDMESSSADFAKSFNQMLVNSIAESLMTTKYKQRIDELYKNWSEYMEDGDLDDSEIANLQEERDAIYDLMKTDRESLRGLLNSGSAQGISTNGFATASQDSIDELNGRFTAIQIDTNVIRSSIGDISLSISQQCNTIEETRRTMLEVHSISLIAIDHLESISKNTHELFEINNRLGKIEKNTRNS